MSEKVIFIGREPVPLTDLVKCFKCAIDQGLIDFESYQNAQFYSFYQVDSSTFLIKDCFNDMRFVSGLNPKQALKNYINMCME